MSEIFIHSNNPVRVMLEGARREYSGLSLDELSQRFAANRPDHYSRPQDLYPPFQANPLQVSLNEIVSISNNR